MPTDGPRHPLERRCAGGVKGGGGGRPLKRENPFPNASYLSIRQAGTHLDPIFDSGEDGTAPPVSQSGTPPSPGVSELDDFEFDPFDFGFGFDCSPGRCDSPGASAAA